MKHEMVHGGNLWKTCPAAGPSALTNHM